MKRGSRVPSLRTVVFTLGFGIVLSIPLNSFAVSEAAFMSLLISPSPAANAMGGAYGSIMADSPLAVMMNPASLGMFGRRNVFGTEYYPQKVRWPPSVAPGMDYDAKSTAFCLNLRPIHGIHFSVGIGIYGSRLNMGKMVQTDPGLPDTTGGFMPWEQVNGTAVSVTFEYIATMSLGYTFKSLQGNPAPGTVSRSHTHDFGMAVQIPVFRLFRRFRTFNPMEDSGTFEPFLDPGFYFSRANIDGQAPSPYAGQADPLPKNISIGIHVSAGLKYRIRWGGFSLISLKWVREMSDLLVRKDPDGTWGYASGLHDIDFFDNVVRGKSNPNAISKRGLELGLLDLYFYRRGRVEDIEGGLIYDTEGYGINFLQPLKLLAAVLDLEDNRLLRFFSTVSFEKHYSKYISEKDSPLAGIRFSSYVIRLGDLVQN